MMPGLKENLVERIAELARRAAARVGLAVWDVEFSGSGKNRILRIYIDKPEGVSHADCELMSQQMGAVLDVEDLIQGASYNLEVSSPGIERRLRTAEHFERSVGQKARVTLREPVDGQKRWEGTVGWSDGVVVLDIETGKVVRFRPDLVEKAHLKYEW
jgi:ribosome maturation factor RimP